jgi:hypothetical protein
LIFQYIITTFELVCTSNFDTMFIWLKYWQTRNYITNYYAKHVVFLFSTTNSNLLDHVHTTLGHWQVGPITVATGRWCHVPTEIFDRNFLQYGDVSTQQSIYRGTPVATGITDINRTVATENHNNDGRLSSSVRC